MTIGLAAAGPGASTGVAAAGVGSYSFRAATLVSVLIGNSLGIAAGTLTAMTGWWAYRS